LLISFIYITFEIKILIMSKHKKPKDEFLKCINWIFTRKRSDRKYNLPVTYITSIADKIHKLNPSMDILINILSEFYEVSYEKGYTRHQEDCNFLKAKREKHIADDWNTVKDKIDDEIHSKN
jgi:hypothetical protein